MEDWESLRFSLPLLSLSPSLLALLSGMMKVSQEDDGGMTTVVSAVEPVIMMVSDAERWRRLSPSFETDLMSSSWLHFTGLLNTLHFLSCFFGMGSLE